MTKPRKNATPRERVKLRNKKAVDKQRPEADRYFVFDDSLAGFYLRVYPSGRKVFGVQYRNRQGRTRRVPIGHYGATTPEAAWRAARDVLARVDKGEDPAAERSRGRHAPTVAALAEMYMEKHARPKKKPSSIVSDERLWRLVLLPSLGHLQAAAVTRADVAAMHHVGPQPPPLCQRESLVRRAPRDADDGQPRAGAGSSNPCRHVDRYPEKTRRPSRARARRARRLAGRAPPARGSAGLTARRCSRCGCWR